MISHSGIVQIYEYGLLPTGEPWLLMEFIEGETLSGYIQSIRTGTAEITNDPLSVLYQLAATLTVVHSKGIVHRERCHKTKNCRRCARGSGPGGGSRRRPYPAAPALPVA